MTSCVWNLRLISPSSSKAGSRGCSFQPSGSLDRFSGLTVPVEPWNGKGRSPALSWLHLLPSLLRLGAPAMLVCSWWSSSPPAVSFLCAFACTALCLECPPALPCRASEEDVPHFPAQPPLANAVCRPLPGVSGSFWLARRVSGTVSHFRAEHGTSLETL